MYSTRVSRLVKAEASVVYRALLDADTIGRWRVPGNMSAHVHEFDAREGGFFRVSLTYDSQDEVGKSSAHTDTYHGHFVKLVANEQVVEVFEFETGAPELRGEVTMTTTLAESDGGTEITMVQDGMPDSVSPSDNELGMRMALDNLAKLVEG